MEISLERLQKEIRNHLEKAIPGIELDFDTEIDMGFEDIPGEYHFAVARKDYDRFEKYHYTGFCKFKDSIREKYNINLHVIEITPQLMQGSVGDFVLIYSDGFYKNDSESHVGLISSVREVKGKKLYGCRYIIPVLGNHFAKSKFDEFEITDENYGGYHEGFLKILTKKEMKSYLEKRLENSYKEALKEVKQKFGSSKKAINELLNVLVNAQKVQSTSLLVDNEEYYFSGIPDNMKIPAIM